MSTYDEINKKLNDEMQELANKIGSASCTETDRNRLATIMYPKLKFFIGKFFNYDQTETEEVLHNTLFKIFKGFNSYSDEFRFTTWIYTIARNEALLHKHRITSQITVKLDTLTNVPNLEDNSVHTLEREYYLDALFKLTQDEIFSMPDCPEKFILIDKEVNKMKGSDIADKYKMNLNTVKTKIRKAKKIVRDKILQNNPAIKEQINEYF